MYLALDPMLHLLVARVEDPTSLSQRKLLLADKEANHYACIKRYGRKRPDNQKRWGIIHPFEGRGRFPDIRFSRLERELRFRLLK